MSYLHACNVIHRDLKCHNLFIDKDWNLKVGDFGLSRGVGDDNEAQQKMTVCGTPSWTAPEVMRHQNYTLKADVYSFGISLWEMFMRRLPYANVTPYEVVLGVATKELRPCLDASIPTVFADIMTVCWAEDPNLRPHFVQLTFLLERLSCPDPLRKKPYRSHTDVTVDLTDANRTSD
eukprot:TRINITY_DN13095_c0_g1_i2.p1 TRINITY_DN13095_c0_g1~~TRINITY_DN13095_c0_g1_i2.p1  ORF type:complete len:191 (+),score=45.26 TRINITY_DN13095_c0_g1_i2:43-573(+)